MKIYIGWDSKQQDASDVCEYSIYKHARYTLNVQHLKQHELRESGAYYRDPLSPASTEFTYTRFLVPFLNDYKGWSMFCDSDFLFTHDITSLFDRINREPYADDYAVFCVRHLPYDPKQPVKFWGHEQVALPRKNWSSFMIFNNNHPSCRKLTPLTVSNRSAEWLHRFHWCHDREIGDISYSWNWLVGEYGVAEATPKALHFTNGGPWNDVWGQQYEQMWLDEYKEMTGIPYGTIPKK